MTYVFAEKCGLAHLIDKRFQGMAVGVGSSKIIGRIHAAPIKVEGGGGVLLGGGGGGMPGCDINGREAGRGEGPLRGPRPRTGPAATLRPDRRYRGLCCAMWLRTVPLQRLVPPLTSPSTGCWPPHHHQHHSAGAEGRPPVHFRPGQPQAPPVSCHGLIAPRTCDAPACLAGLARCLPPKTWVGAAPRRWPPLYHRAWERTLSPFTPRAFHSHPPPSCCIDLQRQVLHFGSCAADLPFLPEHEIPKDFKRAIEEVRRRGGGGGGARMQGSPGPQARRGRARRLAPGRPAWARRPAVASTHPSLLPPLNRPGAAPEGDGGGCKEQQPSRRRHERKRRGSATNGARGRRAHGDRAGAGARAGAGLGGGRGADAADGAGLPAGGRAAGAAGGGRQCGHGGGDAVWWHVRRRLRGPARPGLARTRGPPWLLYIMHSLLIRARKQLVTCCDRSLRDALHPYRSDGLARAVHAHDAACGCSGVWARRMQHPPTAGPQQRQDYSRPALGLQRAA
jgi:hypothetical protein